MTLHALHHPGLSEAAFSYSSLKPDTRPTKPLRVLLVDDDVNATIATVSGFGRNGVPVTAASSLAEARAVLAQRTFDVVILEINLPDGRGESLLSDIEACPRQPAVIIVSAFLPELHPSALEYHPVTFSKPVSEYLLLQMVRAIARGYSRPAIGRFVKRFNLSNREAEATVLVARGLKAKEIADLMSCSEKTIYAHLARVCTKTGCQDYHELVGKILAFTCHELGHTPPDHAAIDSEGD